MRIRGCTSPAGAKVWRLPPFPGFGFNRYQYQGLTPLAIDDRRIAALVATLLAIR
jgi:hypothetical protein